MVAFVRSICSLEVKCTFWRNGCYSQKRSLCKIKETLKIPDFLFLLFFGGVFLRFSIKDLLFIDILMLN